MYLTGRLLVEGPAGVLDQEDLPGRQGRLALACLGLARSQPVSRDTLTAALWDADGPPALDTALSAVVSKVRSGLASVGFRDALHRAGGCYVLRLPPGSWVDVEVAAGQLDQAEAATRRGHADAAWAAATVATAILRRPFLPGESTQWASQHRARLQGQWFRAADCLAEAWLAKGEGGLAQQVAEETLAAAPFREAAYRLVMRAQLAQGNRADALWTFQRCRDLLVAELGVEPAPETQRVHAQALRQGHETTAQR